MKPYFGKKKLNLTKRSIAVINNRMKFFNRQKNTCRHWSLNVYAINGYLFQVLRNQLYFISAVFADINYGTTFKHKILSPYTS